MSLKQKTIQGLAWNLIGSSGGMAIGFVTSIILAHFIGPEEFGLIGMIAVFINLSNLFLDFGFGATIVKEKNLTQTDLSTIFYVNLLIGLLIVTILLFIAPYVALFYQQEELTAIIRVSAIGFIFGALQVLQNALLEKVINFKRLQILNLAVVVITSFSGVALAIEGYGVWALVYSGLIGKVSKTAMLWATHTWRPSWEFSRESLAYLMQFSQRMFSIGLMNTIFNNLYPIVIGKFFSPTEVGLFVRAQNFQRMPGKLTTDLIRKTLYPVFSQIQHDDARLKEYYRKSIILSGFIGYLITTTLVVIAEPLIQTILPPNWWQVVLYLQLFAIAAIFNPLGSLGNNALMIKSDGKVLVRLEIVKNVLLVIGLLIGIQWGVLGILYSHIIVTWSINLSKVYLGGTVINYSLLEQGKDQLPIVLLITISGLCAYLVGTQIESTSLTLIAELLCGFLCIIGLGWFFKIKVFIELKQFIAQRRKV